MHLLVRNGKMDKKKVTVEMMKAIKNVIMATLLLVASPLLVVACFVGYWATAAEQGFYVGMRASKRTAHWLTSTAQQAHQVNEK